MVEEHRADMSSKDKKDARRIQTNFTFDGAGGNGRRAREPPPLQPAQQVPNVPSLSAQPPQTSRRRDAFGATLTEHRITQTHPNNRPNSPPTESDPAADEFVLPPSHV